MNQAEMKRRQVQAFSVLLTLCNIVVTGRLAGYNGVTYVAVAVGAYTLVQLITGGNISDILGKVLRLRNSRGQYRNAGIMRKNAMIIHLALGLAGSLIVLLCAGNLTGQVFGVQYGALILMILAPAVFLRSVSAVLLGYFQGEGAEFPTMVSGIIRQILILGFSLLFCRLLGDYGSKVSHLLGQDNFTSMYGGVGVAVAISLTELLVMIFLFLIYKGSSRPSGRASEGMRASDSFVDSVRILGTGRAASLAIQLLVLFPMLLGLIFYQKAMDGSTSASVEYGAYGAGYVVLCGIPVALIMPVLLPVCVRSVARLRKEEQRFARTIFQGGMHMGVVHGVFAAVFLAVMADHMGALICPGQEVLVSTMLKGGSAAAVLVLLSFYFGRFLILTGRKRLVLSAMVVFDIVYVLIARVLIGTGKVQILSLVYAGLAGTGVLCIILCAFACMQLRLRVDWLQVLIIPVVAATVEGLLCMLMNKVLSPHMGGIVVLILCLAVTGPVYWAGLLLLRNFSEQELDHVPGGRLIHSLGQMLNVF